MVWGYGGFGGRLWIGLYVALKLKTKVEADEGLRIVLSHPSGGASITASTGNGTIINDDPSGPPAAIAASTTQIAAVDFNGGSTADLLRQSASDDLYVLDGASGVHNSVSQSAAGLAFLAAPDLNGDGRTNLLLQNSSTGGLDDWTMSGAPVQHSDLIAMLPRAPVSPRPQASTMARPRSCCKTLAPPPGPCCTSMAPASSPATTMIPGAACSAERERRRCYR